MTHVNVNGLLRRISLLLGFLLPAGCCFWASAQVTLTGNAAGGVVIGGGVTQILGTPNLSVSPSNGVGVVTLEPIFLTGSGAPTSTCSAIVNNGVFYTSAALTLYQCSNAGGTYVWNVVGSGGATLNALTGAASGGAAPNSTFNGSAAVAWDYHTLGAAPAAVTGSTLFVSCSASAADYTAIQNGLNNSAYQAVQLGPSTCGPWDPGIQGILKIPSGKTLNGSPTTIQYNTTTQTDAVQNLGRTANATPIITFTDASMVAGTPTVTSAATTFTAAVVGLSLECNGAYGTGYVSGGGSVGPDWVTWITGYSGNTLILGDAPFVSFTSGSPTTCGISQRDQNIIVSNIIFDQLSNTAGVDICLTWCNYALDFYGVNGLTFSNVETYVGPSINPWKGLELSSVSHVRLLNYQVYSLAGGYGDGIDLLEASNDVSIQGLSGQTTDNAIALSTAADVTAPGAIADVTITDSKINGGFNPIAVNGDTLEYIRNLSIDGVTVPNIGWTSGAGAWSGTVIAANANVQNFTMKTIGGCYGGGAVNFEAGTYNAVKIDGVKNDCSPASSGLIQGSSTSAWPVIINGFDVGNVYKTGSQASLMPFSFGAYLTINGYDFHDVYDLADSSGQSVFNFNNYPNTGPTLNNGTIHAVTWTGTGASSSFITLGNATVKQLNVDNTTVAWSGALGSGSAFILSSCGSGGTCTLGNLNVNNTQIYAPSSTNSYVFIGSPFASATFNNTSISNLTGCYYGSGPTLQLSTSTVTQTGMGTNCLFSGVISSNLASAGANSGWYNSAANTTNAIASTNNCVIATNGSGVPACTNTLPAATTITTSTTTPKLYGGTAAGSSLSLVSTSGTGSGDSVALMGGTNGGTTLLDCFGSGTYSGNCGIGTTTPYSLFHLVSPSTVTGDTRGLTIDQYGGVGARTVWRSANGTLASPTTTTSGTVLGFFGFRGYNGTAFPTASSVYMQVVAAENFTTSAQGAYLQLGTTPTGSTTSAVAMTILGNGNVGIGTMSPTSKLTVNGAISNGVTTATSSDNRGHITLVAGTGTYTFTQGPGAAGIWTTAPVCIIQDDTTLANLATSTKTVTATALTITGSVGTTDTYTYLCWPGN